MDRFTEKLEDGRNVVRNGISISYVENKKYGLFLYGEAIDKLSRYEDNEDLFREMYNREPPIIGDFISLLMKIIESTNGRWEDVAILTGEDLEKWERWKEAEEQGLLLRLPCKVGGSIYHIAQRYTLCSEYGEERDEYNCQGCESLECDSVKEYYIKEMKKVSLVWIVSNLENFGKTVFLTREEAEKKLKELQKEGEDNGQIS